MLYVGLLACNVSAACVVCSVTYIKSVSVSLVKAYLSFLKVCVLAASGVRKRTSLWIGGTGDVLGAEPMELVEEETDLWRVLDPTLPAGTGYNNTRLEQTTQTTCNK